MTNVVEEAEKLIGSMDFEKVVIMVLKLPYWQYSNIKKGQLDINDIGEARDRMNIHYAKKLELFHKESPDKLHEINRELIRIAKYILRNEQTITTLRNQGFIWAYSLIGELWAASDGLKMYKAHVLLLESGNSIKKVTLKQSNIYIDKNLQDVWKGSPEQYEDVITFLKKEYPKIGAAFILDNNGLVWNEKIKNNRQYLAALIHVLMKKRMLDSTYSAPDLKRIIMNTFNFKKGFNLEPLKSIYVKPPKDLYLIAFDDLLVK